MALFRYAETCNCESGTLRLGGGDPTSRDFEVGGRELANCSYKYKKCHPTIYAHTENLTMSVFLMKVNPGLKTDLNSLQRGFVREHKIGWVAESTGRGGEFEEGGDQEGVEKTFLENVEKLE